MTRVVIFGSCPKALLNFRGRLMRAMRKEGHEVLACAPGAPQEVVDRLEAWGIAYYPIDLKRTGLNPLRDLASARQFLTLLRELHPDVVFSYTIKPVIYGSTAAHLANTPHIYSMITGLGFAFSGSGAKHRVARFGASLLYRLSLRFNDKVIFQNHDDLNLFRKLGLLRPDTQAMVINGSGVDTRRFRPAPFPKRPTFLLLARLIRDKGIREYVEAAQLVKARHPHVRFRLGGFIDERPSAITRAELERWESTGTIEYLGHLDDVRPALEEASVFVLPSYREGLPLSVLEAMAMGRPIVTTDVPGCRETVNQGENGFLVPARSPHDLAEAMERFIANPEYVAQFGHASRRLAEDRFDVHEINHTVLRAMALK
jgi:glycosyltransferase involved in cell wall biosynthesis